MENLKEPLIKDTIEIRNEFINENNVLKKYDSTSKLIMKELLEMGFSLNMIEMVHCFCQITSIEHAITLLSKEGGVWQHNYIEAEDKLCVICSEHTDHINLRMTLHTPLSIRCSGIERVSLRKSSSLKSQNPFERNHEINLKIKSSLILKAEENSCMICEEIIEVNTIRLTCIHLFCSECWLSYLEEKINTNQVCN
jgi:hypothetical protein